MSDKPKLMIFGTAWQEDGPGDNWTFTPKDDENLVPHGEYRAASCVLEDGEVDEDGDPVYYCNCVAKFTVNVDEWRVDIVEVDE
jgi:hypothetical protein